MKRFSLLFILCALLCAHASAQDFGKQRYVGGDISMLPKYEQYNSPYRDAYEQRIDDLIPWFISDCGWNTFRVRIFVHPNGSDPAVCQDLAYVTALGKRIKDAGAFFMLDFHYSDTWVDAGHIQAPAAWKGASDEVMADSVASYTHQVLQVLKESGATPDLVQVGNEIMYGLCDRSIHPYYRAEDNWSGYLALLQAGCNAVRNELPEAKIIIHTDRSTNPGYNKYYYDKLIRNEVDFDIIGLSYYPFWHGYLTDEQVASKSDKNNLVNALNQLATDFPDKDVQIVECAYNFQYWPTQGVNTDTRDAWECSKKGQYAFVKDLVDALKPLENVTGINYWFPEEAGNGDKGTVISGWLNRGFWAEEQSSTGHYINRTKRPSDDNPPVAVCAPYYLGTFVDKPQGIENSNDNASPKVLKTLRDGKLYIERNGVQYSILGQQAN